MLQSTKLSLSSSFEQIPKVFICWGHPQCPTRASCEQLWRRWCANTTTVWCHCELLLARPPWNKPPWVTGHKYEVFRKVGEVLYKNLYFSCRGCLSSQDSFMSLCSAEGNKGVTVCSAGQNISYKCEGVASREAN